MACCTNPEIPPDYDDFSVGGAGTASTDVSEESPEPQLTVPHDRCTPLFRAIEQENWQGVVLFLNTGKWSDSMWKSSVDHLKSPAAPIQAKTWVISYKNGKEDWSQLPIHAAISYSAPAVVIQKLVEMYPQSVKERDGEGMLPIHLAFGFGSNDTILSFLLRSWPASVNEAGPRGRLPHECCDLGPYKAKGEVLRIIAEQTGLAVQQSHDSLWTRCVVSNAERLNLQDQNLQKRHLTDLLTELLEDRAQLQELKEKLKTKFGNTTGSSKSIRSATKASKSSAKQEVTSPKSTVSNELIPSPRGHGTNPPWVTSNNNPNSSDGGGKKASRSQAAASGSPSRKSSKGGKKLRARNRSVKNAV